MSNFRRGLVMPEYNPKNEVAKKQYEDALLHGKCRDPKTVKAVWNSINLFEEFTRYADFRTLHAGQANGLSKDHWANTQPVREIFKAAFQRVGLSC